MTTKTSFQETRRSVSQVGRLVDTWSSEQPLIPDTLKTSGVAANLFSINRFRLSWVRVVGNKRARRAKFIGYALLRVNSWNIEISKSIIFIPQRERERERKRVRFSRKFIHSVLELQKFAKFSLHSIIIPIISKHSNAKTLQCSISFRFR